MDDVQVLNLTRLAAIHNMRKATSGPFFQPTTQPTIRVALWVGDLPSPAARKISPFRTWTSVKPCTRLRYAAHGKHKLAQVSGFRDQETEVGNTRIHT